MIDDLVLVMEVDPPDKVLRKCRVSFEYIGLVFSPIYRNGVVIRYESNLRNLKVKLNYNKLILSGSWHKFYHGNNWGDYNWREIGFTLEELLEVFGEPFLKARISKLTFSCNLAIAPKPILAKILAIKGVNPSDMLGGTNHRSYGKYHRMTHYRYKLYDKETEVLFHNQQKIPPLLRLEKEIVMRDSISRAKNPVLIYNPLDLLKREFVKFCFQELTDLISHLEFSSSLQIGDFSTSADLEAFQFMNDLNVRAKYKTLVTIKTFRSKKKQYDALLFAHCPENLNDLLQIKTCEKISELAGTNALRKTG